MLDRLPHAGGALQRRVVHDDKAMIARLVHVEFNHPRPASKRQTKGRQRVLGGEAGRAPVGDRHGTAARPGHALS